MNEGICGFCEVQFTSTEQKKEINGVLYHYSTDSAVPCFYRAMHHMKDAICHECDQPIKPDEAWCIVNGRTHHYRLCNQ